jgi:hypothetical protein
MAVDAVMRATQAVEEIGYGSQESNITEQGLPQMPTDLCLA